MREQKCLTEFDKKVTYGYTYKDDLFIQYYHDQKRLFDCIVGEYHDRYIAYQGRYTVFDLISALYTIFHAFAKTVSSKEGKQKIEKSLNFLNKLKTIEEENTIQDKKDVEDLEKMLSDL